MTTTAIQNHTDSREITLSNHLLTDFSEEHAALFLLISLDRLAATGNALLEHPTNSHSVNSVTNCPELVSEVRLCSLTIPCAVMDFTDCEESKCSLSEHDRHAVRAWLPAREQEGTHDGHPKL